MVIFVLGGSGSGKSEYAESLAVRLGQEAAERYRQESLQGRKIFQSVLHKPQLVYIATMEPLDKESRARVDRHRKQRAGKQFETRECYTHIEELNVQKNEILLLECLSNLTANEYLRMELNMMKKLENICRRWQKYTSFWPPALIGWWR